MTVYDEMMEQGTDEVLKLFPPKHTAYPEPEPWEEETEEPGWMKKRRRCMRTARRIQDGLLGAALCGLVISVGMLQVQSILFFGVAALLSAIWR
mgnify:CR=1 FL=1